MNRTCQRTSTAAVVLLFFGLVVLPAAAQQPMRTLEIRSGSVYVDGERVPPDALPSSLDVEDLEVQLRFSGAAQPVIELGGTLYALRERRLYEVEDGAAPGGVSVFFRSTTPDEEGRLFSSSTLDGQPADDAAAGALEADRQALRQIEQQRYLQEMRRQSQALYERLMREQALERATYALAEQIRARSEGAQRQALVNALREKLDEIFALKQENRRREIERLEEQLDVLRRRLQEREDLHEEIVERRLHELLSMEDR